MHGMIKPFKRVIPFILETARLLAALIRPNRLVETKLMGFHSFAAAVQFQ